MRIGVGLPNTIPGTPGPRLVEWAREAESMGFSTLGTIGRLVFPTYDEFQALAAAAAVTERIGLLTNVAIGPVYDRALLAKLAAGVDQLSGGPIRAWPWARLARRGLRGGREGLQHPRQAPRRGHRVHAPRLAG